MSLISEALRKAGGSSSPPGGPSSGPRRPLWLPGAFLLLALMGGLFFLDRFPSPQRPPLSPESQPRNLPSVSLPSGVQLLRSAEAQWKLHGILRGGDGKALALINNRVIEEGETIDGAQVVRVAQDRVELETEGKLRTLTLR